MDESSSHETNGIHNDKPVNEKESDRMRELKITIKPQTKNTSQTFAVTVKDMELTALYKAAKDRNLTPVQYLKEIIEAKLMADKYLPDWWLTRRF